MKGVSQKSLTVTKSQKSRLPKGGGKAPSIGSQKKMSSGHAGKCK